MSIRTLSVAQPASATPTSARTGLKSAPPSTPACVARSSVRAELRRMYHGDQAALHGARLMAQRVGWIPTHPSRIQ